MTPQELIAYYQALLIAQYAIKTKAVATIGALSTQVVASNIYTTVRDGFAIPTAVGAQLDILGQYRGIIRQIFGLSITKHFFSLVPAASGTPGSFYGFALAAQAPGIGWYFIRTSDINAAQYILNDGEFSNLLAYVAALQSANLTLQQIDNLLVTFFGQYVILTDNGDMSITYTHDPADPNLLFAFVSQLGLLPRPAGVKVIVS